MAVNLTPQYHEAQENFRKAKTNEDKLSWLKQMWIELPKHKASEKVQMELKTRISEITDDIEREKAGPKKTGGPVYKFPKQGAGQVVLIGAPNAGRSRLLSKLTKASPEVAPYPFTTREPVPGMMDYEDVRLQLIELTPITADAYESHVTDITRSADAAVLCIDLSDDDALDATEAVIARLTKARRHLLAPGAELPDDPTAYSLPTLLLGTKADADGAADRLEFVKELFGGRFPIATVAAETDEGLEALKAKLYELLGVMRIYTKQPGKPAERTNPFTIPVGGTVYDLASKIHTDLGETMKSAKVWGAGGPDGQTVKKDHVLHEGDTVELQG